MDTTLRRMTEEAADLHLSLDCEDSVVKSQTLHLLPPEKCVAPAETVFLSRTKLTDVAESILKNRSLKNLYLEGNQIVSLPDSMFTSLPNLVWLDLRNNHISFLPMKIGFHRSLKTLLLEGNPISELPPELGNVMTLKALNLRNCPVRFPPPAIVNAGVQSILQFLRSAVAERSVHVWTSHSDAEMPLVEKLQLSELVGSSMDLCEEEEGEAVDKDELHKFRDLKHRMILMDRAELDYDDGEPIVQQPSAQQPRAAAQGDGEPIVRSAQQPRAAAQGDGNREPKLLAIVQRKKEITRADIIPARHSFDIQHGLRSEERRLAAIKELKEKQAMLEQRRKDQEFLQEWRKHTKAMQDRKVLELKKERHEKHRREEQSVTHHAGHNPTQRIQKSFMSQKELEESRAARDLELELRIQSHVQMMQERCRHPAIGTAEELITAAKQDMEETKKLQAELLERKQTRDLI